MINSVLTIIILLLLLIIFTKKNKEGFMMNLKKIELKEYKKYMHGKKIYSIFTNEFVEKYNKKELYYLPRRLVLLYRLYLEIKKIEGFDYPLFMKLIQPYRGGYKENFGIFHTLHPKKCIEILHIKKNKLGLTDVQKKSLENYYKRIRIIDIINEIIDHKELSFVNCVNIIEEYFKLKYKDSKLLTNFSFFKFKTNNLNINDYSYEDLKLLKKALSNLPENPCNILELIIETESLKKEKINKLKSCKKDLEKFLLKQYSFYGIKIKDDILNPNLRDLDYKQVEFMRDLYKYIINCDDVKIEEKDYVEKSKFDYKKQHDANEFLRRRVRYNYNLKKSINSKKVKNLQIKKCLNKMKAYMKSMYKYKKIHNHLNDYPLERLNKYSEEELEKINDIYNNVPDCKDINKEILINKIYKIYDGIIRKNDNSYGCKHSIDMYYLRTLPKMLDMEYSDFKNRDYLSKQTDKKIKKLYSFVVNTPACYDLTYNDIQNFDERNSDLLLSYDYNFDKAHIMDPNKRKIKVNQYKVQNNRKVKGYHPYLNDHKDYPTLKFDTILKEGDNLDKYFRSPEFGKAKCEGKFIDKSPKEKLQDAINQYIDQTGIEGVASIYSPTVEVDTTKNLTEADIEAIKNKILNMQKTN